MKKPAYLNIPKIISSNLQAVSKQKNQVIKSLLRSFINIIIATAYKTEWANLSRIAEIVVFNQNVNSDTELNWKITWDLLKKMQGKKCISLKKSRALMFRIKCINKILPTKDICYLRNSRLYKSRKCIACFREDKTFYYLAECEIYQRIWKKLEEEAIQLTGLEVLTKLDLVLSENSLKEVTYGTGLDEKKHNRKMHLRGLTSIKQLTSLSKVIQSKKKASRVLGYFIKHFQEYFFERLWKFRCEVIVDWEKENNITVKEKKKKQNKRRNENKENIQPFDIEKEGIKEKEARIQKEASNRVDKWVRTGKKEGQIKFKTKQVILIQAGSSLLQTRGLESIPAD